MNQFLSSILLLASVLVLSSCNQGGSDTSSADSLASANGLVGTADSQTYTINTIAGFESGLIKLAHIDDTLANAGIGGTPGPGDVIINFGPNSTEGTIPGLLANCEGITNYKNCDVYGNVTYAQPGTYTYRVSYDPKGLLSGRVTLPAGTIHARAPGDFVIVSIGDSVASGEGSPMYPWIDDYEGPYWNDRPSNYQPYISDPSIPNCHRSAYAGPVLAVNKLKQTNDITFIHIACSGAKLHGNPMDPKSTVWELGQIERINAQLDWVREKVSRIDALIISGGANNASGDGENYGFGAIIERCVNPFAGPWCSTDADFRSNLRTSIGGLPVHFAALQTKIQSGNDEQVPRVVAITEYFDPTRDANGEFPNVATSIGCGLGVISPSEWEFLYNEMVVPLNREVRAAANLHRWVYVEGIADAFRTHGYCASATPGDYSGASWVVKVPESLYYQKDASGTGHPDLRGQGVYRDRIYTALVQANPPRTVASATSGGQPYTFGTWTAGDVEVTLTASNPIRESGVRETYYTIDDPQCSVDTVDVGACLPYSTPVTITESGRHTASFFSYNQFGAPETRTKPVEVFIDKEPPVMTCSAIPNELWPPNKRMVGITVSVTAVDEVSGPADYLLVSIQDSAGDAANAVQDFVIGTNDTEGSMLSDRTGYGGDRYYTLTYRSEDAVGNVGTCDVVVMVPHDQGKNR